MGNLNTRNSVPSMNHHHQSGSPISLSRNQLITLKSIRNYEENPPDFKFILKKNLSYGLKISALWGFAAYLMYLLNWLMPAAFVLGIIYGSWLIIFLNIAVGKRFWPFLARVIDWQKCDELLEQNSVEAE